MARPGRPERNRAAQSFRQLRRFHHVINSDRVFGIHRCIPALVEHTVVSLDRTYHEHSSGLFRDFPFREMRFDAVLFRFSADTKSNTPAKPPFFRGLLVGAKGFEPSTPSLPVMQVPYTANSLRV